MEDCSTDVEEVNILVLLIKDVVVVEVSSIFVVSKVPGPLYMLNTPNQWLRVLSLGRAKKELVMEGCMNKRRMANTIHFLGSLSNNPHGCILKLGTHSPNW